MPISYLQVPGPQYTVKNKRECIVSWFQLQTEKVVRWGLIPKSQ